MFPVPDISTETVIGSFARVCCVLMEEVKLNVPTALEKFTGFPSGNCFTFTVNGLVTNDFLTSAITSWVPKKVETFLPEGTENTISNRPDGMVILPDR